MLRGSGDALAQLTRTVADVDRLILLGDVIELRHGPVRDALSASEPVFRELGATLGSGREVVIVPGNHDHWLLSGWLERRARRGRPPALGSSSEVDHRAGEPLAALARWLAPATVSVRYPGVWLREDVYATHGHYCDRHTTVPMFERLGAGAMARIAQQPDGGPRCSEDYEAILAPIYAWIHAVAQHGGPDLGHSSHGPSARAWRTLAPTRKAGGWRHRALVASFPALVAALNRAGLGPLKADLTGAELRRASLRAFAEVVRRLDVSARYVIFGHSHRAGPLPRDDHGEWRAAGGAKLINSGCWVHEPAYLGSNPRQSPYRPGFAVLLDQGGQPPMVEPLLDGVRLPVPA